MDLFKKLELISFERMAGTEKELDAAKIIMEEVKALGGSSELEPFEIDNYQIEEVSLTEVDNDFSYKVTGYGMSGSTDSQGIIADFLYVEDASDINIASAEGKIVLINNRMLVDMYKELVKAKVAAFISYSGSFYTNLDLEERYLRPVHLAHGKIPGVNLDIKDAEELIKKSPKKLKLILKQKEIKLTSHNVIATIKGTSKEEEIIALTAHYDSVKFSPGVYDNATGSIALLAIYEYFIINKPERTLKFIWAGCEERGLLGSKAYCEKHQEELKKYLFNINIDMIGVIIGKDMAICTSDISLVNYLNYFAKIIGFPIKVSQDIYSSDSTVFADNKVPSMSFARNSGIGGAQIHSRLDTVEHLGEENMQNTINFIIEFTDNLSNSVAFPIPREVPVNMIEKIDNYFSRKKDKK